MVENSKTANRFVSLLQKWVEKEGLSPLIDFFVHCYPIRFPATPPPLKTLWKAYLMEILPDPYARAVFANTPTDPIDRNSLVDRLVDLSEYTPEQTVRRILRESILQFLSTRECDQAVIRIFRFHRHVYRWLDGSWHRSIVDRKSDGFRQIEESLQFKSDWACARFLRNSGYPVAFSWDSYRAWSKFSGQSSEGRGYAVWEKRLKSLGMSELETIRMETFLDILFGNSEKLGLPRLCSSPESCADCPLSSDCRFYRDHYSQDFRRYVESRIRSGEGIEISTREILQYLLNRYWDDSDYQNDFLDQFPDISPNVLNEGARLPHHDSFAFALLAVQELIRRKQHEREITEGSPFSASQDVFNHYRYPLSQSTQESFHILILDNKHRALKMRMVTTGTLNQSLVHPREVFAPAIQLRAAAIILIHNHPSGDPEPSQQDVDITKRLAKVGGIVGIKILDHVIIGKDRYYSFMDEGRMP